MAMFHWSKTAATNATADPTINQQEGMAPSAVNDSARAMMARTAEWRDDISGTITTGGSSTAYTVTSNQIFDTLAHMNGAMISFVPHTTCGTTVTLNVDGLGAKPLRSAPSVEIGTGTLTQGTAYVANYNNGDGAFYLQNFYNSFPSGTSLVFQQTSAPTGWTKQSTHNDKALRVVSGTASSGGTVAFSTCFSRTATDSHTLVANEMPSHVHGVTDAGHVHAAAGGGQFALTGGGGTGLFGASGGQVSTNTASATTGISIQTSGGDLGHTHPMDIRVQFVDVIIATKN
jgi:hypothetical protein